MKIGILIVFRNKAHTIDIQKLASALYEQKNTAICLVNDGSTDETLAILEELKTILYFPVAVIDVKKSRGKHSALKAGIRYLNSICTISSIICIPHFKTSDDQTLRQLTYMFAREKKVINDFIMKLKPSPFKKTFLLDGIREVVK